MSFFCCILIINSVADSQSKSEWDSKQIKTEFLQMNDRISLLSQEIANLKSSEWNSQAIKTEFIKINEKYTHLSQQIDQLKELRESKKSEEHSETTSVPSSPTQPPKISTKREEHSETTAISSSPTPPPHQTPYLNSFQEYYFEKAEPDLRWTINDIKNKTKDEKFELLSEVFPLKGYSFGAQALVGVFNEKLVTGLYFKDINNSGQSLDLKLIPEVYCTFKDQRSNTVYRQTNYFIASIVMQYDVFDYSARIIELTKIVNDDVTIDIHVETLETILQGYSYDGVLDWAIKDFRLKREKAEEKIYSFEASPYYFTSPHFYTSPKGYRVRTEVWSMDRNELGEELTVEIFFLNGPNDAELGMSFPHNTTVTLFHPTDPSKHVVQHTHRDLKYVKGYRLSMGVHKELDDFLGANQTLRYRVEMVQTIDNE